MIEIFIVAFLASAVLAIYIYYNIKTENLLIELLDKEEARKIITNLLNQSEEELIEVEIRKTIISETLKEEQALKEVLLKKNSTLEQELVVLKSSRESVVQEAVSSARKDSVKRQRAILKGQAMEQLSPFIHPEYQIKDYKFLGDPIDYVIYKGMSQKSDDLEIIFLDIKTGTAKLTGIQKKVKKAIEANRVSFKVFRPDSYLEALESQDETND